MIMIQLLIQLDVKIFDDRLSYGFIISVEWNLRIVSLKPITFQPFSIMSFSKMHC